VAATVERVLSSKGTVNFQTVSESKEKGLTCVVLYLGSNSYWETQEIVNASNAIFQIL
jgi:hypothetical protein